MNLKKQAFTLVELIVVITILAILGTIAFISLQGYSANSRDSVRISDVSSMKTSLELFHIGSGKYPLPDNAATATYSGAILWTQGTFGDTVRQTLSRNISKTPLDPLSAKEYIYSVTNTANEFQILNLLESDLALNIVINKTNAASTNRTPKISGNYNGLFVKTASYIVPTPSIITAEDITNGLVLDNINIKSQIIEGGKNIPKLGNIKSSTGNLTGLVLSVYTGSIIKTDTDATKALVMQQIQNAYTGSILATSDIYKVILSKTTEKELAALVDTIVLDNNTVVATTVASTTTTVPNSAINVEDVFSTYLYTGNGGTQTINNGINLADNGGMVWIKNRDGTNYPTLLNTDSGVDKYLNSNINAAEATSTTMLTSFNNNGFSISSNGNVNTNNNDYASWTFKEQSKFFDVVKYTGDGTDFRDIPHKLGISPGMIIVKPVSTTGNWSVYHKGNSPDANGIETMSTFLNTTNTEGGYGAWANHEFQTSTSFRTRLPAYVNTTGVDYVAYVFADDPSADGMIKAGSYVVLGQTEVEVNLGYEPQWILAKNINDAKDWFMVDTIRGMSYSGHEMLQANLSQIAEVKSYTSFKPTSTGFIFNPVGNGNFTDGTYIYMAIRAPMKTPTSSSEVFAVNTLNGTLPQFTSNFAVDMALYRNSISLVQDNWIGTRLLGQTRINTNTTAAETGEADNIFDYMDGWSEKINPTSDTDIQSWMFKRAKGFFDVVAYTGDGIAGRTVNHNLGVEPELIIVKSRSDARNWVTYNKSLGNDTNTVFNNSAISELNSSALWNYTTPTNTLFTINNDLDVNGGGKKYIAYLFTTLPGISKVGSYTGDANVSQTINAGFSTGAKYIMIKRTDAVGDWFIWDTTRGIIAGNDPHISLNTTAAEVTTDDSVDPDNSGFIVNQNSATNINVSGASYIYYAISN